MTHVETLSIKEIISRIKNYDLFEAEPLDKSFHLKIRNYVPFICSAIHAGINLRFNLKDNINHSNYQRWFEEDPSTDSFITSMPITIIGKDSRFEYDLNRSQDSCIYKVAWGKQVWKKPLSKTLLKESQIKHFNFFKVIDALVKSIEELHKGCIVFDMHSFNYVRHKNELPVFIIGTENLDIKRYNNVLQKWIKNLKQIQIENFESSVQINGIFKGKGYFSTHINNNFNNTLVLVTEIKKIYCNELDGSNYPIIIKQLKNGLEKSIINTSNYFKEFIMK
jgi:hypothetical protein